MTILVLNFKYNLLMIVHNIPTPLISKVMNLWTASQISQPSTNVWLLGMNKPWHHHQINNPHSYESRLTSHALLFYHIGNFTTYDILVDLDRFREFNLFTSVVVICRPRFSLQVFVKPTADQYFRILYTHTPTTW